MVYWDPKYFNINNVKSRMNVKKRTIKNKLIAWKLDNQYYDGDRVNGYGGYFYQEQRWINYCRKIIKRYNLKSDCKILDIGTKKGFFLQALKNLLPDSQLLGIENHSYPIEVADKSIKNNLT